MEVSNMGTLPYFDVNAETTLKMDAYKKGFGACIIWGIEIEYIWNQKVPLLLVWKGIHTGTGQDTTCEYLQETYK